MCSLKYLPEVNCPVRSAWQAASAFACVAADEFIFQQAFFNGIYPAGQFIGFGGAVLVSSCDLSLEHTNGLKIISATKW